MFCKCTTTVSAFYKSLPENKFCGTNDVENHCYNICVIFKILIYNVTPAFMNTMSNVP